MLCVPGGPKNIGQSTQSIWLHCLFLLRKTGCCAKTMLFLSTRRASAEPAPRLAREAHARASVRMRAPIAQSRLRMDDEGRPSPCWRELPAVRPRDGVRRRPQLRAVRPRLVCPTLGIGVSQAQGLKQSGGIRPARAGSRSSSKAVWSNSGLRERAGRVRRLAPGRISRHRPGFTACLHLILHGFAPYHCIGAQSAYLCIFSLESQQLA